MRQPSTPRLAPVAVCAGLLAAATVGISGCGSDPVEISGGVLSVRFEEYRFIPQDVRVSAGTITIRARNDGRLAHNLKIERDGAEIGGTRTIQHGQTTSATLRLEPGTYRMVCTVGNHEALGMHGELEVE